jgi:hypothetical protein
MGVSSVSVVANSLRLRRLKLNKKCRPERFSSPKMVSGLVTFWPQSQ